jgi:hypothetical protein
MDWTITRGVLQCLAMVLVVGLLGYFVLYYPLPENILYLLHQILLPQQHRTGGRVKISTSLKENIRSSERAVGEQLKSQQNGKGLNRVRGHHSLISFYPGGKQKTSTTTLGKKGKKSNRKKKKKIVIIKKDFFS